MDRVSQLVRLALQLLHVSTDREWRALTELDREIAALLSTQRHWTSAERDALERLRRAHDLALECGARESARIAALLAQMREHRDGWMAYALGNELEEDRA